MPLKEDAIYQFPDGRRFRAVLEAPKAWTFVPMELEQIAPKSWRDAVSKLLFFLEDGKIISINLYASPIIMDTCWSLADLKMEK